MVRNFNRAYLVQMPLPNLSLPVRNTFIHFNVFEEAHRALRKSHSAPDMLNVEDDDCCEGWSTQGEQGSPYALSAFVFDVASAATYLPFDEDEHATSSEGGSDSEDARDLVFTLYPIIEGASENDGE